MRVSEAPPVIPFGTDLVPWVLAFNNRVQAAAHRAGAPSTAFDVVHAHDWLVAYAAAGLKEAFDLPVVATVHATEYGRHQGWLPGPMNKLIHQVEWWLTYEARRVIACSQLHAQADRRHLPAAPRQDRRGATTRSRRATSPSPTTRSPPSAPLATPDGERMVLFAGRLEYEKGVQTVLHALDGSRTRRDRWCSTSRGSAPTPTSCTAWSTSSTWRTMVRFTGFLEDHELRLHYAAADVAVAPSIYEPFGLVAVEAMACGTPVVVGDTGGLREIVSDGHGLSFPPQDADELADRLVDVLTDAQPGRRAGRQGPPPHRRSATTGRRWPCAPRGSTTRPSARSRRWPAGTPAGPARPAAGRPDPRARRRRQLSSQAGLTRAGPRGGRRPADRACPRAPRGRAGWPAAPAPRGPR